MTTDGAPVPDLPSPGDWATELGAAGWLDRVTVLVEQAMDQLVLEFVELPFLHRVEHSLHCELYALLTANRTLGRPYELKDGTPVQLVHKEWPETKVRPGKSGRGNFDMVVLDPAAVAKSSVADFEDGRVNPAVVIEVGLNYGKEHLMGDMAKLINSAPPRAYLVHLAWNPAFHLPAVVDELVSRHGARLLPRSPGRRRHRSDSCAPPRSSDHQPAIEDTATRHDPRGSRTVASRASVRLNRTPRCEQRREIWTAAGGDPDVENEADVTHFVSG